MDLGSEEDKNTFEDEAVYSEFYEEETNCSYDDFLHDPAEFASFISSGYGTRSTSTLGIEEGEMDVNASGIINSLQLNIPELTPILSNSPKRTRLNAAAITANSRPKMTDLGFKLSKMIMSSSSSGKASNGSDFFEEDLLESGDALVDNYGQPKKRQKTGKRGRPKGTTKVGTQFGRASSTHALPPNVSALMGQANVAYVQKQYPKAIELYLQVVQRAPSSPEPYYSLGLVYEELGDADKAASYFLIAAHLQPRAEGELWRKIAALLVQVDPPRKEQAIYCLTRAIKAPKPLRSDYRIEDDFPLFWLRAKFQLETGQYRSVITGFGAALRGHFSQDPEDLELFVQVAKLSMRMSLAYVAAGVFQNVFRSVMVAALPLTWSHLNILIELWEIDDDYRAIIDSIEEFGVACYLQSGREQGKTDWHLKSPKEQLEKALGSGEMPTELKLKLAVARVHLRQPPFSAEALLGLLNQIAKPSMKAKIAVADALSVVNAPMSAVQILLECIDEDAELADPEMCLKIGQNYRKAGEIEMAIESLLAVLQVEPEHRATRLALSEAYRSLGKIEEALQILPSDLETASKASEEEFLNWRGLDELFVRVVGVGIDRTGPMDTFEEVPSDEDEIYTDLPPVRSGKLRFGPERTRRTGKGKRPPLLPSSMDQRAHFNALIRENDAKAAGDLLQFFSDNVEHFRGDTVPSGGLEPEEWSEALLKILALQACRCRNKNEWDRLIRIYRNMLATNLRVIDVSVKWRVMGLLLAERAGRWDDVMIEALKNLIGKMNEKGRGVISLLPGIYLTGSPVLLAAFYHPITFRFMTRLNRRWMCSTAPLLVLLGHQSLETQNYEEAIRMYWRASNLIPQWRFLKLCIGNGLLGRAFQRTCSNQLATLAQAVGYILEYSRESSCRSQGYYNAARAMHQAGFLDAAVKFYKRAMEEGPTALMAKYNLSRLYLQCGSAEMARLTLKK